MKWLANYMTPSYENPYRLCKMVNFVTRRFSEMIRMISYLKIVSLRYHETERWFLLNIIKFELLNCARIHDSAQKQHDGSLGKGSKIASSYSKGSCWHPDDRCLRPPPPPILTADVIRESFSRADSAWICTIRSKKTLYRTQNLHYSSSIQLVQCMVIG